MPDIGPFIRTDYKAVDKRDEIRNVLGWVRGDADALPVITDEGKPFGIVSERAMLGRRIDPHAKIEGFALTTRAISPQATLEEAVSQMAEFRASHLPVDDGKGGVAGYVSGLDIAGDRVKDARARDLCVPVTTLREDQMLSEAHNAFHKEYVDHLPVLDKDGRIAGVVPRRTLIMMDARQKTSKGRKDAGGERIHPQGEALTHYLETGVITCNGGAPGHEVLKKVQDFGYCIVQADNGSIVGIVTPETLVRHAAQR